MLTSTWRWRYNLSAGTSKISLLIEWEARTGEGHSNQGLMILYQAFFWHDTITDLMSHWCGWTCSSKILIYSSLLLSVSLLHIFWSQKWTSRNLKKGKDHTSSRKEASEERKLGRREDGSQETAVQSSFARKSNLSQAAVNNLTFWLLRQTVASFSTWTGEVGREEGTHQPQS